MKPPASQPPASSPPPALWEPATRFYRQLIMAAMGLLVLVLAVHLLQLFATVLQQLFIAAFLAYVILPAHRWLVRHRVWPVLSFLVIVLVFLAGAFALGQMIYYSVEDLRRKMPDYEDRFTGFSRKVTKDMFGVEMDPLSALRVEHASAGDVGRMVRSALGTFVDFLSNAAVILVYLVFILAERGGFVRRIRAASGELRAADTLAVVDRINAAIEQYIAVKAAVSLLAGVLTTAALQAFGVDYAVFWGFLTFALNFIPYLGSLVATMLPVLLSLVQFESLALTLGVLVTLGVIQNGIGYAIEPRLAGRRLDLSPLVIILSLAFWGSIWGVPGMILAVPLVVTVKTILENIPQTRPIAMLLSNQ